MPVNFRDISKVCKHCGTELVLNNSRDIERKNAKKMVKEGQSSLKKLPTKVKK